MYVDGESVGLFYLWLITDIRNFYLILAMGETDTFQGGAYFKGFFANRHYSPGMDQTVNYDLRFFT